MSAIAKTIFWLSGSCPVKRRSHLLRSFLNFNLSRAPETSTFFLPANEGTFSRHVAKHWEYVVYLAVHVIFLHGSVYLRAYELGTPRRYINLYIHSLIH